MREGEEEWEGDDVANVKQEADALDVGLSRFCRVNYSQPRGKGWFGRMSHPITSICLV